MVSLKQRQSGFTIVELLIVIVIIGILATLVIVTFSGVQQRARDSERKTDINAVAGQLEAVYAKLGAYPTRDDVNDQAWRTANEFRLDMKAFADPTNPGTQTLAGAPAGGAYSYEATPGGCTSTTCTGYTLTATLEQSGAGTYTRSSN